MGASDDMTPLVLGVIIAMLALGGIVISLRVYTRTVLKRGAFGRDDSLIIVTWFIILAYNTCMFVSVSHGYGKHLTALTGAQYEQVVKAEVIGQACAIAAFPTGKASVAICLMRIFPGRALRWSLLAIVAANTIVFYLDAILILVQCNPVNKQWDFSAPGVCWDPSILADYGIFTGAVGCATDFVLAAIPWFYVARLRINRREKIGIGIALSFGFLAGGFSILKIYYTTRLNSRTDYAYDTIPLVLWSCAELCAINIAACIPTLRPLLQRISPRGDYTSDQSQRSDKQAYLFKTYGSHFAKLKGVDSSTGSGRTQLTDEQILIESTFKVEHDEHGSADKMGNGVSHREAAVRF